MFDKTVGMSASGVGPAAGSGDGATGDGEEPNRASVPAAAPVGFGAPPPAPASRRFRPDVPTSRDVLGAIIVGVALILAGVPLGLLWGATTPKLNVRDALGASTGVVSEASFNTQAGVDMHFALIALLFGIAAGLFVGWRGRTGSWPLPLAIAIGGVAGSLVAAQVGHLLESNSVLDKLPESVRSQLSGLTDFMLRSHGFHVVFPLAALITYLLVVAITTRAQPPVLPDEPGPGYWAAPR